MLAIGNRSILTALALVAGLYTSACSKKAGDAQTDTGGAAASTASSTVASAQSSVNQQPTEGRHPMGPGPMGSGPMGPGMEGHGPGHDDSHGGRHQ